MKHPQTLNLVTMHEFEKGRFYFVLTTSDFGIYAMWNGVLWSYISDDIECFMAYGETQVIYEAPQP